MGELALKHGGMEAGTGRPHPRPLVGRKLDHDRPVRLLPLLELPATTLARLTGHADAGFTLKVYACDGRDETAVVDDVLARASGAGVAG